jgi:hypothetical protein
MVDGMGAVMVVMVVMVAMEVMAAMAGAIDMEAVMDIGEVVVGIKHP